MVRNCIALVVAAVVLVACAEPAPPDSATLIENARLAMGADNLATIEFSGNGWDATTGQPWNINEGWPQWTITDYNRVIDYDAMASRQTAVREIADPMKLGGGGAQPGAAPQNQNSNVTEDSGWTQRLQISLTPHGFLRLAEQNDVTVSSESMDGTAYNVASFSVTDGDQTYNFRGYFNEDNMIDEVQTWIPDAVLGDMLVEAEFGDYQDFDGVMFPTSYVHKHGGFGVLNLTVDNVVGNTTASAVVEQAAGGRGGGGRGGGGAGGRGGAGPGGAAPAEEPAPFTEIGDGIFVIDGGYQAVAVEFEDHSMVIEGIQNNARAADLIEITKMAIPDKPIQYVVTTHAHWDHISGLREFVAEGATVVVPQMDAAFFEEALNAPRTLEPDRASEIGATAMVLGVADGHVFEDTTGRVEMHKIEGSLHADDMMVVYLPSIQTVVEADLAQPWLNPNFGGDGDEPHPFLVHLADELDRIGLDYVQFVSVHRPTPAPFVPKQTLMDAVGR
jgi:glyoxylase-like metal-dependent hydrolase (beta-lactamase superfamily II)